MKNEKITKEEVKEYFKTPSVFAYALACKSIVGMNYNDFSRMLHLNLILISGLIASYLEARFYLNDYDYERVYKPLKLEKVLEFR